MTRLAAPPDVIRWAPRSGDHNDCAVAALMLACGVTYEVALAASLHVSREVLTDGLDWTEIQRAVRRLGMRPRLMRRWQYELDDEDTSGILSVFQRHNKVRTDHVVYLWGGRVIEPDNGRRQLWRDPEAFLRHYGYRAGSLLVVEGTHE